MIKIAEDSAFAVLDSISKYYMQRAKLVTKVMKVYIQIIISFIYQTLINIKILLIYYFIMHNN